MELVLNSVVVFIPPFRIKLGRGSKLHPKVQLNKSTTTGISAATKNVRAKYFLLKKNVNYILPFEWEIIFPFEYGWIENVWRTNCEFESYKFVLICLSFRWTGDDYGEQVAICFDYFAWCQFEAKSRLNPAHHRWSTSRTNFLLWIKLMPSSAVRCKPKTTCAKQFA